MLVDVDIVKDSTPVTQPVALLLPRNQWYSRRNVPNLVVLLHYTRMGDVINAFLFQNKSREIEELQLSQ